MHKNPWWLGLSLLTLGACDRAPPELLSAPPPEAPRAPAAPAAAGAAAAPAGGSENRDVAVRPVITIPAGAAPTSLQREDIVVGTGAEARTGQAVTVRYSGMGWSSRREFDSSWNRGQPFPFTLGQGQVIPGWDQGVVGMRVGGRRKLVIPPSLGYGERGSPPAIGPNETLVFIVDLLTAG